MAATVQNATALGSVDVESTPHKPKNHPLKSIQLSLEKHRIDLDPRKKWIYRDSHFLPNA